MLDCPGSKKKSLDVQFEELGIEIF